MKTTHKYHRPVNWHISGDKLPVSELPRKPLECTTTSEHHSFMCPNENLLITWMIGNGGVEEPTDTVALHSSRWAEEFLQWADSGLNPCPKCQTHQIFGGMKQILVNSHRICNTTANWSAQVGMQKTRTWRSIKMGGKEQNWSRNPRSSQGFEVWNLG